jgi:hypothetical protein
MELSGQLHAPVALLPPKEHQLPNGQEDAWAQKPVINEQKTERDRIVTLSHILPNLFTYPVIYETQFPFQQIKMM